MRSLRILALAALTVLLGACSSGDGPAAPVDMDDPPPDDPPDDVQFVTLAVTVRIAASDTGVSRDLGWDGDLVPGAVVTVQRVGSELQDTIEAGQDGKAVFEDLLEGNYTVSAIRLLGPSERDRLSEGNAGVAILGGGITTQLTPTAQELTLQVNAGRRGSLVISELEIGIFTGPGGDYLWARYIELYNNADTTVYLDGLIVGNGWDRTINAGQWPCTDFEFFRSDPEGLWARLFYQVPGNGRSHPLRPGRAVVMATDAIDHSEFLPGAPDLSRADFEFLGRGDVDNPSVPNLVPVGPGIDLQQRGLIFHSINAVPFVAHPVDVATLPRRTTVIGGPGVEHVRIPKEALIDVGHFIWFGGRPVCSRVVHPEIDQGAYPITLSEAVSLHRRTLLESSNGHPILQDTNTSQRDFRYAPRSPGEVSR